jgi:hypothetical protein
MEMAIAFCRINRIQIRTQARQIVPLNKNKNVTYVQELYGGLKVTKLLLECERLV